MMMTMTPTPRYALYFSPAADSRWWEAGCRWLGRDPVRITECEQAVIPGLSRAALSDITADARRYGFHATLKNPFCLAPGFAESHLCAMAEAFCSAQKPVGLDDMQVSFLGDFLALRPAGPSDEVSALAMRCVQYFDILRGAPTAAERARRERLQLTKPQAALLHRWGYPYVGDEYRFHMTLTDSLAALTPGLRDSIRAAATQRFAAARQAEPVSIDALSIFREEEPGAPLTLWRRMPFSASRTAVPTLPAPGRLFFFVGPSGVGKDTLLQWVRRHLPADAKTVFAKRTITRPAHASEAHESVSETEFLQAEAHGRFAMTWHANGHHYGVPRGIEAELQAGQDVIVNGSREYIPQLRQRFPDAMILWVDADPAQVKQRLQARQREAGAALLERLERAQRFSAPQAPHVICLDNSGPPEVAGRQLLHILGKDCPGPLAPG